MSENRTSRSFTITISTQPEILLTVVLDVPDGAGTGPYHVRLEIHDLIAAQGSAPPPENVMVPNIVEAFVTDAIFPLQQMHFRVELVSDPMTDVESGVVFRQEPQGDVLAPKGSIVRLFVANPNAVDLTLAPNDEEQLSPETRDRLTSELRQSTGGGPPPPQDMVPPPNVVGIFVTDAFAPLQQMHFRIELVSDSASGNDSGIVIGQEPSDSTPAVPGSTIRLVVSNPRGVDLTLLPNDAEALSPETRGRLELELR